MIKSEKKLFKLIKAIDFELNNFSFLLSYEKEFITLDLTYFPINSKPMTFNSFSEKKKKDNFNESSGVMFKKFPNFIIAIKNMFIELFFKFNIP